MNNQLKKERLIILSDLWGKEKSEWISYYTSLLENHFDIHYYDCCDLGNIDKSEYSEKQLHQQFITIGIQKAVENILQKEQEKVHVLGFSIGGTIAWKAAISGLKTKSIFAISSTRLRIETNQPLGIIELFYGANDTYQPDEDWFLKMDIKRHIYENENHNMYQKRAIAEDICTKIIKMSQNHRSNI
ncbi:MAG TPA: hypothetical protein VLZ75_05775 [Chitinophagales bacterium]|nr:hypothetical protein [Chitinophagales bacterium]